MISKRQEFKSTEPYNPSFQFTILSAKDSKKLFNHYRGSKKRTRKHPITLNQMKLNSNNTINNLNPFIISFLQSPKEKTRGGKINLSTPPLDRIGYGLPRFEELSKTFKENPEYLMRSTIDFALALRSLEGPNQIIAEDLADQISLEYKSLKLPLLISLRGTLLKQLPGSKYDSLGFKITNNTQIVHAPILNEPGYFLPEDIDEKTCLPKKTRKERKRGDLELITEKAGLTRVYINIYQDIECSYPDLGRTDYSGRLFVVRK